MADALSEEAIRQRALDIQGMLRKNEKLEMSLSKAIQEIYSKLVLESATQIEKSDF